MKFLQSAAMPRVLLVAVAIVIASGCTREGDRQTTSQPPAASHGGDVVATYAGKRFTTEDFRRELERLPPRSRAQLTTPERKRQFVDNYVLNELLADEGHTQGYDHDPEISRQVDDLRRRLVVQRVMKDFQEPPEVTD